MVTLIRVLIKKGFPTRIDGNNRVKIVHGTLETLIPLLFQIDLLVVIAFESKILQNGFGRLFMDIIVRHQKEKFGNTFFSWRFTPPQC
jgi:hypothetical protein